MGYKTVGIVITDEDNDLVALDAAMSLASRENGHLDVVCLGLDPVRYDMAPMGSAPALTLASTGEAHDRAKALVAWAQDRLRGTPCPTTVRPLVVTSVAVEGGLSRALRYSDLIVASQPYGDGSTQMQASIVEAAILGTGAPVLIIPRTQRDYSQAFSSPMVAWTESDESLEAARKAIPFLTDAKQVEVVLIDPPSHSPNQSDPGGGISKMLTRHGVKTEVSILAKTMPRVSEVINRHARDRSCDLIIMGAYGHSRFREALFGGATRDMLETAEVPVLMAH